METVVVGFSVVLAYLRIGIFWLAVALAVAALLDWLVRARRINPFSGPARIIRRTIDPLFMPMEKRVVRAGGLPSAAPWWTLAAAIIGGIVLLGVLGFVRDQLAGLTMALQSGPRAMLLLVVEWIFGILQLALLVRVLSSLLRVNPWGKWVRWSYVITEPMLAPLRSIIPTMGMFDFSPLIAWFILSMLERFTIGAL